METIEKEKFDNIDNIVNFFVSVYDVEQHYTLPCNVVMSINELDRAERGELKFRLFNEAKRLGKGGDAMKAIRWLETTFDLVEKNSFRLHEVMFSPGQDIPENIAYYLSRAKRSIDLCVFTISDESLAHALKAAHARGVKIRLITDNNKMRDYGSQVKELARAGIEVKIDNSRYHMHNKFGLIDGRIVFTGSYNWTYTAKMYNQENIVITTNYTIVHKFIDEFERLWQDMYWLRVKQHKGGQLKAELSNDKDTWTSPEKTITPPDVTAEDFKHKKRRKKNKNKPRK